MGKWEGGKRAKRGGSTWGSDRKKGAEGEALGVLTGRKEQRGTLISGGRNEEQQREEGNTMFEARQIIT